MQMPIGDQERGGDDQVPSGSRGSAYRREQSATRTFSATSFVAPGMIRSASLRSCLTRRISPGSTIQSRCRNTCRFRACARSKPSIRCCGRRTPARPQSSTTAPSHRATAICDVGCARCAGPGHARRDAIFALRQRAGGCRGAAARTCRGEGGVVLCVSLLRMMATDVLGRVIVPPGIPLHGFALARVGPRLDSQSVQSSALLLTLHVQAADAYLSGSHS